MPIITLTSDWIINDFYVGAVKGQLLSKCKDLTIVDISHNISAFNTAQTAFVLRNSYRNFPEGTIHLIFVNSESSDENPVLAVKAEGHIFIGADNGIFSLILGDRADTIIRINHGNLQAIEAFTAAACKLAAGTPIGELGKLTVSYKSRAPLLPTIDNRILTGSVIYIDSFENAITNVTKDEFESVRQNRSFEMYIQSKHYKITTISEKYNDVPVGELVALFNSVGLLEIAINSGNAARLLNLEVNSTIRVEFSDKKN